MKKVMATMLAAATAATMLSGCGSSNSGSTETKAAETTAAAESGAKAEETTAADAAADGREKRDLSADQGKRRFILLGQHGRRRR